MAKRFSAIIVAAGAGKRMNSTVKKQYIELNSHPILSLTLKAFEKSNADNVIVVTGKDEIAYVREEIVQKYCLKKVTAICAGGAERCDSVYEGLKQVLKGTSGSDVAENYVLIHDGVRPLVTPELINSCIENAVKYEACIPGVPEKDTVKEADENMDVSHTPDRKKMYRIQTPQCFSLSLIKEAFVKFYEEAADTGSSASKAITDDAMLVEKYTGHKVKIVPGDYKNIKITTPEDIGLAEYYMNKGEGINNGR